jgi:ATP-dependent DNA ligase
VPSLPAIVPDSRVRTPPNEIHVGSLSPTSDCQAPAIADIGRCGNPLRQALRQDRRMQLPVMPPLKPMLAKATRAIPPGMLYEPKWDGFRAIIFRDGDEVEIGSRNERPLTRYFPEVVAAVKAELPERCVVDGEIVIVRGAGLDFEALLQRIHPAASRINRLAAETPAAFVAFDLLALGDESLVARPFEQRRAALESAVAGGTGSVYLTPNTSDLAIAQQWFDQFEGAGLDGVVGKPRDGVYAPDQRVLVKIKHLRTADCVVAGFRWHKSGEPAVGSLLLGLWTSDEAGQPRLQHIGVAASFPMARRRELAGELEPYRTEIIGHPWDWAAGAREPDDRTPRNAEGSRWNAGKDLSFVPLRPELVCEVAYDHMEGPRLRHTAQFQRWRPDRDASSCTYDQLERPVAFDVADVLAGALGGTPD